MEKQRRVIALEEAFWTPAIRDTYPSALIEARDRVSRGRLGDVGDERIRRMDAAGIDLQVLSHVCPGVQEIEDAAVAVRLARAANDWLATVVERYPTRFAAFATIATQDPTEAARELERTVTSYGFKGALINGHTQGHYMDERPWWVVFDRAQALDVPIYLHPSDPPRPVFDAYFKDYPELATSAWGWGVDTGTHLLRLVCGGVFDAFPRLKVMVGHMGEMIPFHLKRIHRGLSRSGRLKRTVFEYMHDHVFVTTSGVFEHASLVCALSTIGIDNLLFAVDDPFADNAEAVAFLESAPLSEADRDKLAHGNAERLLRLAAGHA
jgi:predicted TIM-barrel fold metal-dependent hydrolase